MNEKTFAEGLNKAASWETDLKEIAKKNAIDGRSPPSMSSLIETAARDIVAIVDVHMRAAEKETADRIRQLAKDMNALIGK